MIKNRIWHSIFSFLLIIGASSLTMPTDVYGLGKKPPKRLPECPPDGTIPKGGCRQPPVQPDPYPNPETPTGECDEADTDCDGRRDLPPVGPGPLP